MPQFNDKKVLVVGGAGYVGSVLTRVLLDEGYRVRVLDNLLYGHGLSIEGLLEQPGFEFFKGDLCLPADLDQALQGVTDVVLLASLVGDPVSKKYPDLTRKVNDEGSKKLFETLKGRGIDRFVFTSTCSNYGLRDTDDPAVETDDLNPLSLYAETKVSFEKFVLANLDNTDVTPTLLRISTAFGLSPRMRFDLTVNEFTYHLAKGKPLDVYDKDTWRPYCHVRDISAAIVKVLKADKQQVRGEVFNVGSDENNYTKAMIVDEVLKHIDGNVTYVEGGFDARNYRVSFKKIKDVLGFEAGFSVADYIPRLIQATQQGLFSTHDEFPGFYGNYEVKN